MVEIIEEKKDNFRWENGVKLTWDNEGNIFVSMPVNSIPKKQFDDWIVDCKVNWSGKRWDMILNDHIKAQAYDNMLNAIGEQEEEQPEKEKSNPLGLLNGGE